MAELGLTLYGLLLPFAWLAFAVSLVVCGPLALFRSTRRFASFGIIAASWLIGATTWCLGFAVTLSTWGWLPVIFGLLIWGIGVVPIAVLASFISLENATLGASLIAMCVVTFAFRFIAAALLATLEEEAGPPLRNAEELALPTPPL